MSAQHTLGRLVVRGGYSIYTTDGTPVADTCLTASVPQNDEANARRLVACWNACDGIDTYALDLMTGDLSIKNQITATGKARTKPTHRAVEYRRQRDELLAALERTTEMCEQYADWIKRNVMSADFEQHPYLPELEGAAEDARAAIAEVKGGAL